MDRDQTTGNQVLGDQNGGEHSLCGSASGDHSPIEGACLVQQDFGDKGRCFKGTQGGFSNSKNREHEKEE